MRTEVLCISVLRVASGPRVKLASCKSTLNPPVVYSTDSSKAVVPVLVLLLVLCGLFNEAIRCMSYLVHFVLVFFSPFSNAITSLGKPASVAQLDAPSDWRPGGHGFNPRRGRQHSFMEIDHEIFSAVILSLPLIQEGQLPVSGERVCTILINRLED